MTMKTKIKLAEINVTHLSTEAINLLSKLTFRIRKQSKKPFSFSDPRLLEKISYAYKRLNDPEITQLYKQYKLELKRSVNGLA